MQSQAPSEYFPGIKFNYSFYTTGDTKVTLEYVNNNFLKCVGYAYSRAISTSFNGILYCLGGIDTTTITASGLITSSTGFKGNGAQLTNLNASNISDGTLTVTRGGTGLSTLPLNQILIGNNTSSIFSTSLLTWDPSTDTLNGKFVGSGNGLTNLNADNFLSGILDINFGGTGVNSLIADRLLIGGIAAISQSGNLTWTAATNILTASNIAANGSRLTNLNASNVSDGTLGIARGGTGAGTFTLGRLLIGNGTTNISEDPELTWTAATNTLNVTGTAAITTVSATNIGIGITNPTTSSIEIVRPVTTATNLIAMRYDTSNGLIIQQAYVAANDIKQTFIQKNNNIDANTLTIYKGHIGIGTTTPSNILQIGTSGRLRIANTNTDYTLIGSTDVDGSTNTSIIISGYARSASPGNIQYLATGTSGTHIFYTTGTTTQMIISSVGVNVNNDLGASGNVGFGVAPSATYKLNVNGTLNISGLTTPTTLTASGLITANGGVVASTIKTTGGGLLSLATSTSGSTRIGTNDSTLGAYTNIVLCGYFHPTYPSCILHTTERETVGHHIFFTTASGFIDERMRIWSNGAVGIQKPYSSSTPGGTGGLAISAGYMAGGSLAIGNTGTNYGGGSGWNSNTAGLLMECSDQTEIAVHDSGASVHSLMYYSTNGNITIGRNMGWGTANVNVPGNMSVSGYVYGGNYVQGGSFYLVSGRQVIYSNGGTSGQGNFEHLGSLHCFFAYIYGVRVIGNFSVDAGYTKNWRIKHPILKDKDLIHTCIEGTRADNLYRGRKQLINGECVVNIDLECNTTGGMTDGTFVLINKNIQVFVNNNETFDRVIGKVVGNKLNIKCENVNADCMIDWLVIGERCDDGIINNPSTDKTGSIIVEIDRPNDEVPPQPNYKI